MKSFKSLLKIEFILTKRSLSTFVLGIGLPVMIFLLMSKMLENSYTADEMTYVVKYMLISMAIYSSISFALYSFPMLFLEDRNNHWLEFVKRAPISMPAYYLVKVIRIIFNFLIAIVLVFLVGKIFKEVDFTIKEWIISGLIIILGTTLMLPMGFLLSLIKSAEKLTLVSNVIYIFLSMIGGLWFPLESFPDVLQKVGKLTPTYNINHIAQSYLKENIFQYQSLVILLVYAIILIIVTIIIQKKLRKNQ